LYLLDFEGDDDSFVFNTLTPRKDADDANLRINNIMHLLEWYITHSMCVF